MYFRTTRQLWTRYASKDRFHVKMRTQQNKIYMLFRHRRHYICDKSVAKISGFLEIPSIAFCSRVSRTVLVLHNDTSAINFICSRTLLMEAALYRSPDWIISALIKSLKFSLIDYFTLFYLTTTFCVTKVGTLKKLRLDFIWIFQSKNLSE